MANTPELHREGAVGFIDKKLPSGMLCPAILPQRCAPKYLRLKLARNTSLDFVGMQSSYFGWFRTL